MLAAAAVAVVGYAMHRGCLALAERSAEPDSGRFSLRRRRDRPRTLIVLEDVANPENVGAIFRNALALGADASC